MARADTDRGGLVVQHEDCCPVCRSRIDDHRVDLALVVRDVEREQGYGKELAGKIQGLEARVGELEDKRIRSEGVAEGERWARLKQLGKGAGLIGSGAGLAEVVRYLTQYMGG